MAGRSAAISAEPLTFSDKLRALAALAVSIWLWCAVGDMAVRPDDPLAAFSLAAHESAFRAALSAALLTIVVSMLASVVGPARLPGFAGVAVCLGWATLNWRCGTMEHLLVYEGGPEAAARSALFGRLAMETVFWCVLAAGALWIEAAARGWLGKGKGGGAEASRGRTPGDEVGTGIRRGLLASVIAAVLATLFVSQVAGRSAVDEIHKGQIYFAVGGGFFLGALVGLYFSFRVSPAYFVLGVGVAAAFSYLWGTIRPMPDLSLEAYRGLLDVPPTPLIRPLPVEYVALGVIGATVGTWSSHKVYVPASEEGA
jgi:hypothetical protein